MKRKTRPVTDPEEIREVIRLDKNPRAKPTGWSGGATNPDEHRRDNTSLTLHCTKCSVNTAGTYASKDGREARCPACSSLLMYCPNCRSLTSATEKFNVVSCDRCDADFVTRSTIEYLMSRDRNAREIVISGIRATGELHLGNYLGAVRKFVEYEKGDNLCLYFIADWHTLTTCHDPQKVAFNSTAIAMDYLAAGLNPERSIIYSQSSVPEIAELALLLSMVQLKNNLEDLATIKDLVKSGEPMRLGHLSYPVLMAADILGPKATLVPVGKDQLPNIELAIDLARKFNNRFGTNLVIPKASMDNIKVPGLGGGKMGKSIENSTIALSDNLTRIKEKYHKHGTTDPGRVKKEVHHKQLEQLKGIHQEFPWVFW